MRRCKSQRAVFALVFSALAPYLMLFSTLPGTRAADGSASLAFQADPEGGFVFNTGVLRGKLRAHGKALGLSSVVHVPTGLMLDQGDNGYGLFSHYRVFTTNKRYGTAAWGWPSSARLRPDGAVEVSWAAATNRPFAMQAVYRWTKPDTLDLETMVEPQQDLPKFESFLASYFAPSFTNASAFVSELPGKRRRPGFLAAEKEAGVWQMFPREAAVIPLIQDGRWRLEPNPVAWVIQPALAQPIALRRDPASGVTAALMAPKEDCFAIAMPHQGEGHYSLYLSLFGRDLKAGENAVARTRLVVLDVFVAKTIIRSQRALSSAWRQ